MRKSEPCANCYQDDLVHEQFCSPADDKKHNADEYEEQTNASRGGEYEGLPLLHPTQIERKAEHRLQGIQNLVQTDRIEK
jgi:hypothetical protein